MNQVILKNFNSCINLDDDVYVLKGGNSRLVTKRFGSIVSEGYDCVYQVGSNFIPYLKQNIGEFVFVGVVKKVLITPLVFEYNSDMYLIDYNIPFTSKSNGLFTLGDFDIMVSNLVKYNKKWYLHYHMKDVGGTEYDFGLSLQSGKVSLFNGGKISAFDVPIIKQIHPRAFKHYMDEYYVSGGRL